MNRLKKDNSGFTLLEIIIVVIIVGVMASLALPRLFANVEFSRSTEATAALASIRSSIERCMMGNAGDADQCDDFADIDITDQGLNPGSHFGYTITGNGLVGYTITATRNTVNGGTSGELVRVIVDGTGANITGTTAFDSL